MPSVKTKGIEKRRNVWFAIKVVPADVRSILGKRVFRVTTQETDPHRAMVKAAPFHKEWERLIEAARARQRSGAGAYAAAEELEAQLTRAYRQARTLQDEEARDRVFGDALDELPKAYGVDVAALPDTGERDLYEVLQRAGAAGKLAANAIARAVGDETPWLAYLDEWQSAATIKDRQLAQYLSDIRQFGRDNARVTLEGLTGAVVQRWVDAKLADKVTPVTGKTIARKLAALHSYWSYLASHHVVPDDRTPFRGRRVPEKTRHASGTQRKAFQPADIVRLHEAAAGPLRDLIWLAAHTGARIEELCQLQATDVNTDKGTLEIRAGKTAAAARIVPIHKAAAALVSVLQVNAWKADGYLIPSTADNQYSERAAPLSKSFGRLRTKLGYGPELVFHSIRKTVATLLEEAECPEGIAADLLGHEKPTITYGLYSGGSSLAVRRQWLDRAVNYREVESTCE